MATASNARVTIRRGTGHRRGPVARSVPMYLTETHTVTGRCDPLLDIRAGDELQDQASYLHYRVDAVHTPRPDGGTPTTPTCSSPRSEHARRLYRGRLADGGPGRGIGIRTTSR